MGYDVKIRIARAAERLFGKATRGSAPIYDADTRVAQAMESAVSELGDVTTMLANFETRIAALEGSSCLMLITAKIDNVATQGITVTAVKGTKTYTATTDNLGVATLHVAPGTYTISGNFDPATYYDITTATITISEHEKKTADVTAKAIALSTVSVKTQPTKTTYIVGETFDPTGTVLLATYNNEATEDVTTGYTYEPTTAFVEGDIGSKTITYTYGGKTCTTTVTVSAGE